MPLNSSELNTEDYIRQECAAVVSKQTKDVPLLCKAANASSIPEFDPDGKCEKIAISSKLCYRREMREKEIAELSSYLRTSTTRMIDCTLEYTCIGLEMTNCHIRTLI